jgi:hypothetical protein
LPDDAGHLVAVEFDDRIFDFDFWHWGSLSLLRDAGEISAYSKGNGRTPRVHRRLVLTRHRLQFCDACLAVRERAL